MRQWYTRIRRPKDQASFWISVGLGCIFAALFIMTFIYFRNQARSAVEEAIVSDTKQLLATFGEIDRHGEILGFDHAKVPINFLDIAHPAGAHVDGMSLAYPEKWRGPYLKSNPMVQNTLYDVVTTQQGTYLAPGAGVRLSNGKVFGADIILTPKTDVEALIKQHAWLTYKGQPLVAKLPLQKTERDLAKLRVEAYGATLAEPF